MFPISPGDFPRERSRAALQRPSVFRRHNVYCTKQCAENQGGTKGKQSFTA